MKSPLTPAGIEPATFRFVAQHHNHCATVAPASTIRVPIIFQSTDHSPSCKWQLLGGGALTDYVASFCLSQQYKLTLSERAQVTLQMRVSLSDSVYRFLPGLPLLGGPEQIFSPGPNRCLCSPVSKPLYITHLDSQTISEGCTERHCNSDELPHNFFFSSFRKANIVSLDDAWKYMNMMTKCLAPGHNYMQRHV